MSATAATLLIGTRWCPTTDGDMRAYRIRQRHYTAKKHPPIPAPRQRRIAGPGETMLLLTPQADALFIWRAERLRQDGQTGINCAVFRNESAFLSSDLIREACEVAWVKWPGERLYTFVNPKKLPRGKRPGYCFECAGWERLEGLTKKRKLIVFECLPAATQNEQVAA